MALIVKSGVGKLHHASAPIAVVANVAAALLTECASFYAEPMPGDEATIFVDVEHIARVQALIKEFS